MAKSKNQNVVSLTPNSPDPIFFPPKIRIRKEGKQTRAFCAETDREILPIAKVKADLTNGKETKATLTLECEIVEVIVVENQIEMFPDEERN